MLAESRCWILELSRPTLPDPVTHPPTICPTHQPDLPMSPTHHCRHHNLTVQTLQTCRQCRHLNKYLTYGQFLQQPFFAHFKGSFAIRAMFSSNFSCTNSARFATILHQLISLINVRRRTNSPRSTNWRESGTCEGRVYKGRKLILKEDLIFSSNLTFLSG